MARSLARSTLLRKKYHMNHSFYRHAKQATYLVASLALGTITITAKAQEAPAGMSITLPSQLSAPSISNQGKAGAYQAQSAPTALAQIVIYRAPTDTQNADQGLFVYLDGALQTALRPGAYTRFCVKPQSHRLDTGWGLAQYTPTTTLVEQGYEAGKTYYFQGLSSGANGKLMTVSQSTANTDLANTQEQTHLISRAASAQACR